MTQRRRRACRLRHDRDSTVKDKMFGTAPFAGMVLSVPGALTLGYQGFDHPLSPMGGAIAIIVGLTLIAAGTWRPTATARTTDMTRGKTHHNREVSSGDDGPEAHTVHRPVVDTSTHHSG